MRPSVSEERNMKQPSLGLVMTQNEWPLPTKVPFAGHYMDLVPLSTDHAGELLPLAAGAPESFAYPRYGPFDGADQFRLLLHDLSNRVNQPFWAVKPKDEQVQGWLSLCDIYQGDGSIEIGSVWFSPQLQGTRVAREAIFILMCHAMDDLGYERLVWRCQAQNVRSFKAAENLGFSHEGTWRNAAVVKGWQRDVAWFSTLKHGWPQRKAALSQWLLESNFDELGQQIERLGILQPNPDRNTVGSSGLAY